MVNTFKIIVGSPHALVAINPETTCSDSVVAGLLIILLALDILVIDLRTFLEFGEIPLMRAGREKIGSILFVQFFEFLLAFVCCGAFCGAVVIQTLLVKVDTKFLHIAIHKGYFAYADTVSVANQGARRGAVQNRNSRDEQYTEYFSDHDNQ